SPEAACCFGGEPELVDRSRIHGRHELELVGPFLENRDPSEIRCARRARDLKARDLLSGGREVLRIEVESSDLVSKLAGTLPQNDVHGDAVGPPGNHDKAAAQESILFRVGDLLRL